MSCKQGFFFSNSLFNVDVFLFFFRYEEAEVRKKLEEKERLEEKKKREDIEKKKDVGSPKASAANKKDSKKVQLKTVLDVIQT